MTDEIDVKKFYLSRTFWVNVISMIALLVQAKYGFIIAPEDQIAILGIVNLILRAITKKPLEL